jgi:DNA-directed RNA polymerase subunit omega
MIEDLKNMDLIKKIGGKYKLTALIQRRVLEIMQGSRPLIENTEGKTTLEIVIQEILQNKIVAEYGKSDQTASEKPKF